MRSIQRFHPGRDIDAAVADAQILFAGLEDADRLAHEPLLRRVTHVVDFLAMPGDDRALKTLLRWVDREARMADSDKIRCHALHAGFRRVLRRSGYFGVRSGLHLSVKLNDPATPATFYEQTDDWHVTLGDGPVDL